jgi:hypothetical protein
MMREVVMNAMEKVAWTHFTVSAFAVAAATVFIPWLGPKAAGMFGILAIIPFSLLFLRKKGNQVIVDERDREIERRATSIGIGTAWMMLLGTLITATMWSSYTQTHVVSTVFLNWLIWIQCAVCYGMKGLAAIVMYQRQQHAA